MTFNIHQQVFDRDGMPLEKKANQYKDQLVQLFEQSPEGLALWSANIEPGWAGMLLDFGIDYLGVTPPQMSPDDVREILFDLIPRKVSASADEAPEIIHELRAFWIFLQREFHLRERYCLSACVERAGCPRTEEENERPCHLRHRQVVRHDGDGQRLRLEQ